MLKIYQLINTNLTYYLFFINLFFDIIFREPQSYYRINGLNSVYLSITAEETANQLQLNRAVMDEMEAVRQVLPTDRQFHITAQLPGKPLYLHFLRFLGRVGQEMCIRDRQKIEGLIVIRAIEPQHFQVYLLEGI